MPRKPVNRRCFVIMPFKPAFDEVYDSIVSASKKCGMRCSRADKQSVSGIVLDVVFDEIRDADVVVIDLTGGNPNVFYEAAFAHLHKQANQVVHIAQRGESIPFDLRARRYLEYDDNRAGRSQLVSRLVRFLEQAKQATPGDPFETIEGKLERTRRICEDLEGLLRHNEADIRKTVIRSQAGLGPLAIHDRESELSPAADRPYRDLLIRQRNLIRRLLKKGAEYRLIAALPTEWGLTKSLIKWRYRELLRLVKASAKATSYAGRCHIAVAPPGIPNALILGSRAVYEGKKSGFSGGFGFTTRVVAAEWVRSFTSNFDSLLAEAEAYTLEHWPTKARGKAAKLREGVLLALDDSYRRYLSAQSRRPTPS